MTSELHTPLTLADLIDKELMGVEPDSQCIVLDDADWKMITAALRRYTIEFTRCVSCDGYNCDDGCAYPDTRDQAAEVIAAKDGRIVAQAEEIARLESDLEAMQKRAEEAEAKLAQIEKQEPVACRYRFITTRPPQREWSDWFIVDDGQSVPQRDQDQQEVQPLYTAPVVSDADLRAENERLRAALEFYADTSKYPAPLTGGMGALWGDCGETARAALNPSEPRT